MKVIKFFLYIWFQNMHNWVFIYDEIKLLKCRIILDYYYSNSRRLSFLLCTNGLVSIIFQKCSFFLLYIKQSGRRKAYFCKGVKRKTNNKATDTAELQVDWLQHPLCGNKRRILMFDSKCSPNSSTPFVEAKGEEHFHRSK